MPKLVRLYITQVLIGFGLAAVFVAALLWLNVGHLWSLISTSDMGWIAVLALFVGNGVVFAGANFAITILRMGDEEEPPKGGRRVPVATDIPARVVALARAPKRRRH